MELSTIIYILAGFAGAIVVSIVVSLIREQPKSSSSSDSSPSAKDEKLLTEANQKSDSIIHRASKQARDMLVSAELTGIKEVTRSKHDTDKLEQTFEEHLNTLTKQSATHLESTSKQIEQHYIELFKNAEVHITKQIKDNQQRIVNQLDLVTSEAEKTINTESEAARVELNKRMEAEFTASKQLVQEYKRKRMELVDREIVNIVARTIKRTLGKSLSKKDHADLVYRALEQAKQDGFFA